MIFWTFQRIFALLSVLGFALAVEADDGVSVIQLKDLPQLEKSSYQIRTEASVSIESAQYFSTIPEKPELDRSLLVSAHLHPQMESESSLSALDFTAEKFTNWGPSNFTVRELYWQTSFSTLQAQMTAGRKIEFWSQIDHDWKLGLWQPKSVLDSLRPQEQGLTGFFFKKKEGQFETLALLSPFFIPTMGPEVKEENGNIVSDSRWYRSPSSTFVLFNQQRRVVYALNIPDLQDLVVKPGVGSRVSWGKESSGFWASINLGHKPINQLILKYDRKLTLSEEGQDTGLAPLFPSVTYHTLWGADLGYRLERAGLSISYLEDRPWNQIPQDPFVIQFANSMRGYALQVDTPMDVPGFESPISLAAGYLRVDGGDYQDFDYQGTDQGAVFTDRLLFYDAALVQFEHSTTLWRKKTVSKFKYMRELQQKGTLISAALDFYPLNRLAVTLGADILGVDNPGDSNQKSGFLNEFRANDRFYSGVNYAF